MPDRDAKGVSIKQEKEAADRRFREFVEARETWDWICQRKTPTKLPLELTGIQQGIDYQSPDGEKAIFDLVDFLMINRTMWAITLLEQGSRARDWARDILLCFAAAWEIMDWEREYTAAVSEGQVRHGAKVMQLCHRPPDGYEDDAKPKEMARRTWPFYLKNIPTLACSWLDRESEVDAFWYEYVIPLIDAGKYLQKPTGERLKGWKDGKGVWMADEEIPDQTPNDEEIRVLIRDARNPKNLKCPVEGCDHFLRQITVYVCDSTAGSYDDAEIVEEYDSPYPGCSFFVIPGRRANETNPHLKYRPLLLPLFHELRWRNYLVTLLATLVRKDYSDEDVYGELKAKASEFGIELPEPGPGGTITIAKAGPGEIAVAPVEFKRIPKNISEHLIKLIEMSDQRIRDYMPNPFITGTNFQEAREGTGTANIAATQQARLPFDRMLTQQDAWKVKVMDYIKHAILFWQTTGIEQKFYMATSGGLNVKASYDEGDLVYISAEKLKTSYQLKLRTKSETLQEQREAYLLAERQKQMGHIDWEQVWEAMGITDVEGQRRRLLKEKLWDENWPKVQTAMSMTLMRMVEAKTGVNMGALLDPLGAGIAPPTGSSNGNGARPPASAQSIAGRIAVQPPAIQGATSAGVGVQ